MAFRPGTKVKLGLVEVVLALHLADDPVVARRTIRTPPSSLIRLALRRTSAQEAVMWKFRSASTLAR